MPALRLLLGILVFIAATSVSQAKPTTIDAAEAKPDDDGTTLWYDCKCEIMTLTVNKLAGSIHAPRQFNNNLDHCSSAGFSK